MSRIIDKGIPIPKMRQGDIADDCQRLAKASIGDSMMFEGISQNIVLASLYRVGGSGWYATRKERIGTRAWKVKEPKNA